MRTASNAYKRSVPASQHCEQLEVYGYLAVDDGGYVRILPDANA